MSTAVKVESRIARVEMFDATVIGQRSHLVTVRMQGKDIAMLIIDFGRLP
jgi:hypothetical protein